MFNLIYNLPLEVKNIIYLFILPNVRSMLTYKEYISCMTKYNLKNIITQNNWHSFIRSIIRQDYDLVFSKLLHQNWSIWSKYQKYQYKNSTYYTYVLFIKDYAIHHNSQKIRQLIFSNKCKNKKINIKWSKKSTLRNALWNN
tara:strand:- start:857 stop:1282 length:426 start_codon:yes stop_codon:yes gene_type:complete